MPVPVHVSTTSAFTYPLWTKNLALNHTALLAEMAGIVMGADKPLEMDKWIEFIKDTLCRLLKVDVPSRLILQVMSPMVPFYVAPTPASALSLLRSGWRSKVVGPALAAQTNRLLLAEIADVPVQLQSAEALSLSVTQDLIATLENLHCGPQVHETQDNTPAKKREKRFSVCPGGHACEDCTGPVHVEKQSGRQQGRCHSGRRSRYLVHTGTHQLQQFLQCLWAP